MRRRTGSSGGMGSLTETVFLANVASTLFMVGVIWYVQIVHYPLFSKVGLPGFVAYEDAHSRLTTFVVAPPMLVEISTSALLLISPPPAIPYAALVAGALLVGVVWVSTALLQAPRHTKLGSGFDAPTHRFLVASNWIRTLAWTLRGALVLWMLSSLIG